MQHDLGGRAAGDSQPALTRENDEPLSWWELQVDAAQNVLENRGAFAVDEFRRAVESLPPDAYEGLSYYERWGAALGAICCEKGLLAQADIDAHYGPPEVSAAPAFREGDRVRVRSEDTATRWRRPHLRTPGYLFGKAGQIELVVGMQPNPEVRAFGGTGAEQPLYRVSFAARDLWAAPTAPPAGTVTGGTSSEAADRVVVEVFQHWLEKSDATGSASVPPPTSVVAASGNEGGDEQHDHDHDHGHVHESRFDVEQTAVDREAVPGPGVRLAQSVVAALLAKRAVSREELADMTRLRDSFGESGAAARVVARAWCDADYRSRLLADATSAVEEMGVSMNGTRLIAVANTTRLHNVIVCTLCSCYPVRLLGRSPGWYKSRSYRARVVAEPRIVLREFGLDLPAEFAAVVHDSTSELRYMVLPLRPEGTDGMSEEDLCSFVNRDHLIGVAVPRVPSR
jgi:nitrile hydratase subunit alpha